MHFLLVFKRRTSQEEFKGKKWLYPGEVEEIMQVFNNVRPNFADDDDAPLL